MSGPRLEVLVIFGGAGSGVASRLLRPGFRHCFLLVRLSRSWLLFDPRADLTHFDEWRPVDTVRLAARFAEQGHRVLRGEIAANSRGPGRATAPLALLSCVGSVKRALGLAAPGVVTPYGLFLFLRERKKFLDMTKDLG